MPIFHVDLADDGPPPPPTLARELARELGALLGSEPGHVWVRVTQCPAASYAENDAPPDPRWAFVRLILRDLPPEHERPVLARAITERVAKAANREVENVHVLFEPAARGRIAFGGDLVT
jgi:phenylpyruvate tautomerase PptA (4-oxalocrotonate tautomerase family)